jgi:hypothetical protein
VHLLLARCLMCAGVARFGFQWLVCRSFLFRFEFFQIVVLNFFASDGFQIDLARQLSELLVSLFFLVKGLLQGGIALQFLPASPPRSSRGLLQVLLESSTQLLRFRGLC